MAVETLPLFDISDFDPDDPEVAEHIHGEGCQHPDGADRDPDIVSGTDPDADDEETA